MVLRCAWGGAIYFMFLNMSPSSVDRFLPKRSSGNLGGGGEDCTGSTVLVGAETGRITDCRFEDLFHHEDLLDLFASGVASVEGDAEKMEDLSSCTDCIERRERK